MTSPVTDRILPMFSSASLSDVPHGTLPIEKPIENPSSRPIEASGPNSSFGCKGKSAFHRLSADMNNPGHSTFTHIDATVIPVPYEKDENGVDCYIDKDDVFFLMCPGYSTNNDHDTSSNRQPGGLNACTKASMKSRIAPSTRTSQRKPRLFLAPRPRHQPMF